MFRDGIAVTLLEFELAAPGRPVYDLAHLARLWVPVEDDFDRARLGWRPADRPTRLRLVADAYGLDAGTGPGVASGTTGGADGGSATAIASPRPSTEARRAANLRDGGGHHVHPDATAELIDPMSADTGISSGSGDRRTPRTVRWR